jgi:hypothetical protein
VHWQRCGRRHLHGAFRKKGSTTETLARLYSTATKLDAIQGDYA